MNRIFLTAVLSIGLSLAAFGQVASKSAHAQSTTELVKSKQSGQYTFVLPSGITKEKVEQNAKYYAIYFSVQFVEASREAKINMLTNDEKSRHVICRFLIASGAESVHVNGKDMKVEDFFIHHLK